MSTGSLMIVVSIITVISYIATVLTVKTFVVGKRGLALAEPKPETLRREIRYSAISVGIFCVVFAGIAGLYQLGLTAIYTQVDELGIGYGIGSIFLLILIHDTYFYWTHRLLHAKKLRWIHRIHHLSVVPNPFTALSFHPIEGMLQILYLPVLVLVLPVWLPVLLLFVYYSTFLMNIVGHCGYELFPKSLARTWLGRVANTPRSHAIHHGNGRVNYGLYTHLWDWLMHTLKTTPNTTK